MKKLCHSLIVSLFLFVLAPCAAIAEEPGDTELRTKAYALVEQGDIAAATATARTIANGVFRAKTFRQIAEIQARRTDNYQLFPDALKPTEGMNPLTMPEDSKKDSKALEVFLKHAAEPKAPDARLTVLRRPLSGLGRSIPPLPHPERLAYTSETVTAMLPKPGKAIITTILADNSDYINTKSQKGNKFENAIFYAEANVKAGIIAPDVIYIESGIASLAAIDAAMDAQGHDDYVEKDGDIYLLRHPLMIAPGATLVVDGAEASELKLSQEAGVGITNAGALFITNTKVTAWNERKGAPAFATYEDRYNFRPFISSWSGSHTYLAGSEFTALGYADSKAYGITISSGPQKLGKAAQGALPNPSAIIVENSFHNLYFGFYCFEADDIALIGNEYVNNIVYGIDPHDHSKNLTIAYNTAYGSQEKHGIIISRRVHDASYIGNLVFENVGSGFMIDRLSTGTYIYANTSFNNRQDGITLFESSCNLIASNRFTGNDKIGIRARNSHNNALFFNDISHNTKGGVLGYVATLEELASQEMRDFVLDPYTNITTMTLVGNRLESNGVGIQLQDTDALYLAANSFINQSPKILQGEWFREDPYLLTKLEQSREGTLMVESCIDGTILPEEHCPYREAGVLKADGLDALPAMVAASNCNKTTAPKVAAIPEDNALDDALEDEDESEAEVIDPEDIIEFGKPNSLYDYAQQLEQQPSTDYATVAQNYQLAAQQGSSMAAFALARLYDSGRVTPPSPDATKNLVTYGLTQLQAEAESGNGNAATALAFAYLKGEVLERDEAKFQHWITKAVEMNNPQAQRKLGKIALWRLLPGYTQEDAAAMLEKASTMFPDAQLAIGFAYSGAFGGTVDHARAFAAFRKAAEAGNAEASRQLGLSYLTGKGTARNPAEAFTAIQTAAEAGNRDAMFELGLLYAHGTGTKKDETTSLRWIEKASELGMPEADYHLGMVYLNGDGAAKDATKAKEYLTKAASKKSMPAKKQLYAMEAH